MGAFAKFFSNESGDVYAPGFLTAEIPLLSSGEKRAPTFYRQHGDWFGWSCVGAAIGLLLLSWKKSTAAI
jgi:hypothetical protein